jgi:restriction endonuclease S subunit
MEYEKLRAYIAKHFTIKSIYILPEGTFRPTTAVRTYLITITAKSEKAIQIGNFQLKQEVLTVTEAKDIAMREFLAHEDWRVELLLADDDENIQKFKSSALEKLKLKEVAEGFRGKSILKKDTTLGDIAVLNISNLESGEINYSNMDTITEEERKIKRYELLDGDVILSCRGTAIKSAVFKQQDKTVIASANVIAIRPKDKDLGRYIQIFLESPIGMAMIKSFQRGTTIMNINHSDIMEMEIPIIPIHEQQEMIRQYDQELKLYKKVINEAETRWETTKHTLYNKLI